MSFANATQQSGDSSLQKLGEPFEASTDLVPKATHEVEEKKSKKRSLFGFTKKRSADPVKQQLPPKSEPAMLTKGDTTISPIRSEHPIKMPSSPVRGLSSSPRLLSPVGSQIFERDVQESASLMPNSPAIPSHIQTEDHIPSVLDASSEAIVDDHIDPDCVEIITHISHQPAAAAVTGVGSQHSNESEWTDELAAFTAQRERQDSVSNYGGIDTTDVRRLSFISFADVVQAEHAGYGGMTGSRDSLTHPAGMTSIASLGGPVRSPVSSSGAPGTSSPTSKSGSIKGSEMSPSRRPLANSSNNHHGISNDELNIETMSQALQRTGSGELGRARSLPVSPI